MGIRAGATAALAAGLAAAALADADAMAAQRYATPASEKFLGDCPKEEPCRIDHAVEDAASGDEVIVLPGEYRIAAALDVAGKSFEIHGPDGQPRPRLVGNGLNSVLNIEAETTKPMRLRRLHVTSGGAHGGTVTVSQGAAVVSDLVVEAGGDDNHAVQLGGSGAIVMRDSVVHTTGRGGVAMVASGQQLDLRNLTLVSAGETSQGLRVVGDCRPHGALDPPTGQCASGSGPSAVTARNVIARGNHADLRVAASVGEPGTIDIAYSNFRTTVVTDDGSKVTDSGHNQSAEPLFADAAGGDFHQLAGSPTVDAGTEDPKNGATDIDGDGRTLGAAPDIGADERAPSGGGPGPGPGPDVRAPRITALRLSPERFRLPRRTKIRYTLSEPAHVTFGVERRAAGRRAVDGRCVKPSRKNRGRNPCARYLALRGRLRHDGQTGPNARTFTGRIGGRALKPGRYRLGAVAEDAAGNRSKTRRASFTVRR